MPLIRRVLWSLAASAVITVGLAWECALWSELRQAPTLFSSDGDHLPAGAPVIPAYWFVLKRPEDRIGWTYDECRGFGLHYINISVSEGDAGPIHGFQAEHTLVEWQAGWPAKAFRCGTRFDSFNTQMGDVQGGIVPPLWMHPKFRDEYPTTQPYLPVLPMAWGFLVDVVTYAAVVFFLFTGVDGLRARLRRGSNRCPSCGYDRRGLARDANCPECGAVPSTK